MKGISVRDCISLRMLRQLPARFERECQINKKKNIFIERCENGGVPGGGSNYVRQSW